LPIAASNSQDFIAAAGVMAVMVGVFRLVMGLAYLGMLVNFVSDSVIIGFTAGAGILISINQLRPLLRLDIPSSPGLVETIQDITISRGDIHLPSLILGLGTIIVIVVLARLSRKLPAPLVAILAVSAVVGLLRLDQLGVRTIGELPRSLPPLSRLPLFDLQLFGQLSSGALAVGAIGLVEAMSIARAIASQTGQRLDSNQEFVGQGLANIACGFFSGYTCSGSFTRSAVCYRSGAQTPMASVFSGFFVLIIMLALAPFGAFVPRAALAGILILTAIGMIDRVEIARIWRGAPGDVLIMVMTFLATLFLPLQFAVLTGILVSFAVYILRTSVPRVVPVLPDQDFRHFVPQAQRPPCPQLAIFTILGDLYFGAVNHIEKNIHNYLASYPSQRFILLRMHSVNHCDISGIHALESILRACRDRGGDLFLMRVQEPVRRVMQATGFYDKLGSGNFLSEDDAIPYLFYKILDPAICIYESEARVFLECQNLPKRIIYPDGISLPIPAPTAEQIRLISPQELWKALRQPGPPLIVDVREPREFKRGHIPQAQLIPLPRLLAEAHEFPADRQVVLVCQGGRRSSRAAYILNRKGFSNITVMQGGMLAWENAGLLEAVEV
jgi:SulP family sulfate permease